MLQLPFLSTLRGKLTIWYLATMMSVVLMLSIVFSVLFWYTLNIQIDHHVHIVISEAENIVEQYVGNRRDDLLRNLVLGKGMTVILLSADGFPIIQTNSPDVAPTSEHITQQLMAENLSLTQPTHFTLQNMRYAAVKVQEAPGNGVLAVGYSLEIFDQTMRILYLLIGSVITFILIPFALLGLIRVRKHLQPLEETARLMDTISTKEALGQRLVIQGQTQELQSIVGAFNRMLGKIQLVFSREQDFFSDAAHTLKTPLAILRAQAEQLKEKSLRQEMLMTIDDANTTISDLLLLSRFENKKGEKTERFSLSEYLTECAELCRALGKKKSLSVNTQIEAGIHVSVQKNMFIRAINNIIHNAINYTPKNGHITISLETKNGVIELTIENTGSGLNTKEMKRVYERFFRGKNAAGQKGSGLGLSITKSVINNLKGTLVISSKPSGPTRVSIKLPKI